MDQFMHRKSNALRRVLFLCARNHHESRFCEELFNSYARTEGQNWQAISRAIVAQPAEGAEGPMSSSAIYALRALGAAPINRLRLPLQATDFDFRMSSVVISVDKTRAGNIERLWPEYASAVEYWSLPLIEDQRPQLVLYHLFGQVRTLFERLPSYSSPSREHGATRSSLVA